MKRILSLILAAVMILAAAFALGDDPDPIVGVWYARMDPADFAMFDSTYADYTNFVMIITVDADGAITSFELDYSGTDVTMSNPSGPVIAGKWEKEGYRYFTSIVGSGRQRAYLIGGILYLNLAPGVWYGLRKMETFDFYTELLNEQTIKLKGW